MVVLHKLMVTEFIAVLRRIIKSTPGISVPDKKKFRTRFTLVAAIPVEMKNAVSSETNKAMVRRGRKCQER